MIQHGGTHYRTEETWLLEEEHSVESYNTKLGCYVKTLIFSKKKGGGGYKSAQTSVFKQENFS